MGEEEEPATTMSHTEAMETINAGIQNILDSDPMLSGLEMSGDVTVEELANQLALEHGQAFTVEVARADGQIYNVVVDHSATVQDLKRAIQRHVALKLQRKGERRLLSWRYIWRTYRLVFMNQTLMLNHSTLRSYGLSNHARVEFRKRLRPTRKSMQTLSYNT
ncbi:COX19 [Cordylochernes scorpioides]|uniref:COX19 n=1 Tax=Cordylochernes scorpioides TaxID=51811 RepID=A0ABY6KFC1_9ARAC|nr:COX19 [Cordylochernes scorpioides]